LEPDTTGYCHVTVMIAFEGWDGFLEDVLLLKQSRLPSGWLQSAFPILPIIKRV
jgi:hypothetical protein